MIVLWLKSEENSLSYCHFCINDSIYSAFTPLVFYFTLKLDIAGTTENKVIHDGRLLCNLLPEARASFHPAVLLSSI